jgi:hypothetical protein
VEDMEELGMRSYKKWERKNGQRFAEKRRRVAFEERGILRSPSASTTPRAADHSSARSPRNADRNRERSGSRDRGRQRGESRERNDTPRGRSPSAEHRKPLNEEQKKQLWAWQGNKCAKCGKEGHFARECSSSADVQSAWRQEKDQYVKTKILHSS